MLADHRRQRPSTSLGTTGLQYPVPDTHRLQLWSKLFQFQVAEQIWLPGAAQFMVQATVRFRLSNATLPLPTTSMKRA